MTARVENSKPERVRLAALMQFARKNGLQIGIIGVMLGIWLLFIIGASDTFLKPDIYRALMTSVPYWGVIALPLTMVIIAGDIDLSFISIMAVGMVVFWEAYETTSSLGVAFAASLVSGFLVGLLNGIIVVRLGIPALIATIGTQFFWRGVVEVVRRGQGESLTLARDTVLRDVLVSKVGAADGSNMGRLAELDAIAAVAVGGTSMAGGRAKVMGTLLGAIVMQLITITVVMNNIQYEYAQILKSAIIIFAVFIQRESRA